MSLKDNCGRPLLNLRISVTQRCNNRCSYCHREGEVQRANLSTEKMTLQEIVRITKIAVSLGVARVKLTGGEPLMRQDLPEIIKEGLYRDAKSFFQERAQEKQGITPTYNVLKETGPDHNKHFTIGVYLGKKLIAKGSGSSKQEAEEDAAKQALKSE